MADPLDALMKPSSIAVVGASKRMSPGTSVLRNLKATGFAGRVFGVNPHYDEVEGFPCFASVGAIPEPVDCVVVGIPGAGVPDAMEEAFRAGVRAGVVLASGFGEGMHAQDERVSRLRALVADGMRICGPNCYGMFNVQTGAAAFSGGIADPLVRGPVALVSQSGGYVNTIADPLMEDRNIGFSHLVSCGNQLGVSLEDYIGYFLDDPSVSVVAAFVEGFREPSKLSELGVRARERDKPVIVLKMGRSTAGKVAVLAHSASIAGNAEILDSMLDRSGFLRVDSVEDLAEAICMFTVARVRRPFSREIIVVTGSGGEGSHVADAAEAAGLGLAELAEETKAALVPLLPDFGAARNPVDGTGVMFQSDEVFPGALRAVLADPGKHLVAANLGGRPGRRGRAPMVGFARTVAEQISESDQLVAYGTSSLGPVDQDLIALLHGSGVPYLAGTQRAMRTIALFQRYCANRGQPITLAKTHRNTAQRAVGTGVLPFVAARDLLADFDIPMVESPLCRTGIEAVAAAERLGYPVAVKAEGPGLAHKTESGCVVLGCTSSAETAAAFDEVIANAKKAGIEQPDGAIVQSMVRDGVETIVGVVSDPALGPAVVFGLGGIFVEAIHEVVTEVPPLNLEVARSMVRRARGSMILEGFRGRPPADVEEIAKVLIRIGDLALAYRDSLVALDINPLIVRPVGHGVFGVDALIQMADADASSR